MSAYLKQEFDFIERTKTIIEQYDAIKDSKKYEVTLLMNCFIKLLIFSQQHCYVRLRIKNNAIMVQNQGDLNENIFSDFWMAFNNTKCCDIHYIVD